MGLSGTAARIAYAVLVGVVTFVVLLVVGGLVDSETGATIQKYAALIGVLAGLVTFFARPAPRV